MKRLIIILLLLIALIGLFFDLAPIANASTVSDYFNSVKSYPKKIIGTEPGAEYIEYSSLDGIISQHQADGFEILAPSLGRAAEFCPGSGGEDCGNFVQMEKTCSNGQSIIKQYKVTCDSAPEDPTAAVPCYVPTVKALAIYPGQEKLSCIGGSGGGLQTIQDNVCKLPADVEQKRQEIFNAISTKYKFIVTDSNVCGNDSGCGNNVPWGVDSLTTIQNTLQDLPECFISNLNLNQVTGLLNDAGDSIGEGVAQLACCSPDAETYCTVGKFVWENNYNKIVFCGQRYKSCVTSGVGIDGILVHEMTHALQQNGVEPIAGKTYESHLVQSWMNETGWGYLCFPIFGCWIKTGSPPDDAPNSYAKSNPLEDMAESVRFYYEKPNELKTISSRRYDFIKNNIMCGKEF